VLKHICRKACGIAEKPANLHMLKKKENPAQLGFYSFSGIFPFFNIANIINKVLSPKFTV
jgi:hypothetical protein